MSKNMTMYQCRRILQSVSVYSFAYKYKCISIKMKCTHNYFAELLKIQYKI